MKDKKASLVLKTGEEAQQGDSPDCKSVSF
jgi:hypothetical protein